MICMVLTLGQPVMVLPSQYRPGGRMIFNLGSDGNPVRVDVLPNGEVRREAGPTAVGWVNLSGISFPLGIQGLGAPPSGPGMVSGKPSAPDWIMALFKEIKDEVAEEQGEGAKLAADAAADLFLPVIQKASGKRWDLSLGFDLAKKNDSSSGEYWQADFKIGNQPFSVIVYRPRPRGGQPEKPHLAVVAGQFKIANVLKDLEGTPIGELAVEPAAFVYMPLPKDGQVRTLSLQSDIPAPVRSMIQGTYTYKGGAAPANVTALPGQNLWALIKTQQAEAAGNSSRT